MAKKTTKKVYFGETTTTRARRGTYTRRTKKTGNVPMVAVMVPATMAYAIGVSIGRELRG